MPLINEREGFEALLKPIQDITRVDIDLCQSLEEYLSHILSIEVSPVTFAQAALLVQNSAAIYSKKVDFLWTVVLQLLEALSKSKQSESNDGGEGAAAEGGSNRRKRAHTATISTEDLQPIDAICSDRLLNIKDKKLNKNNSDKEKRVVLNASIKVKTDHNVTCTVYDSSGEIMGKKDEFKLHWRVSADGTLHEEFVNNHSKRRRKEGGILEDMCEMEADISDSPADVDLTCGIDNDFHISNENIFPTPPENSEDVPISECIAENEFEAGAQRMARKENIVNLEDIKKKAWEPVAFDVNMPEKVARKKNVVKVPEALQESAKTGRENRKRKRTELEIEVNSYLTINLLIDKHLKADRSNKYLQAYELLKIIFNENQLKRQVLLRRNKAYQELVINEASKEFEGEFEGFPDMDPESDEEGGFNGFVDPADDHEFVDNDLNVPLPEAVNNDFDHNKEIDVNTYESEALKTLHEYQMKNRDDQRLSGLSERVAVWHKLIRPKLEEAEKKSHFDIHEYGSRILEKFPVDCKRPEDNVIMFSEIVAGLPPGEVARNFLSSLCLANTYNLELRKMDPADIAMDCLQLRLLSRVRHHEEMHDNMKQNTDS
ncbi:condensin-2 complex subunit H2-like isoform X2 [Lycorma delicatula]|uniref:condensin-2 complex subunit H2-like isoform X2 n=1 Tax=Lycorma delicatula TaxID=130591 RepID=UPI003F514818